jgi:hypothetical protein
MLGDLEQKIREGLRNAASAFSDTTAAAAFSDTTAAAAARSTNFASAAGTIAAAGAAASGARQQSTRQELTLVSLHGRHKSVTSIYHEWHGAALFGDKPIPGGLLALELRKENWRSHFTAAQNVQFSRLKRVMEAVHDQQKKNGRNLTGVLSEFDGIMKDSGGNLSNLVIALQGKGYILKKTRAPKNINGASI